MTAPAFLLLLAPAAFAADAAEAVRARAEAAHAGKPEPSAVSPAAPAPAPAAAEALAPRRELDERKGRTLRKDPEGCTWVEGEASIVAGDQDTRQQARASAFEHARAAAVQDFLGVELRSRFMDFQQEGLRGESRLTENILLTTRSGRILKEKVLEEGYRDAPDCPSCRYRVKCACCVLQRDAGGDKDFHVELEMSRVRFVEGDDARFRVTATRDSYLYVYDVYDLGRDAKTDLVLPNAAYPEIKLKAGESWEYPSEEAFKRGVQSFKATLPRPGDEVSAETLRVIVSKAALPKKVYDPADGGWLGVLRRLHRSKVEWTDDADAFTIYKR